jgi:SAM-dependent methyltransferase
MNYLAKVPEDGNIREFYGSYGEFRRFSRRRLRWPDLLLARRNRSIEILENTGSVRGRRVCEVGCSHGHFLELVRFRGGKPFGVEINKDALASLERKSIPHAQELPPDARFDVVCLFQVLEHLVDPGEVLAAVCRTLSQDGCLLLSLPNGGEIARVGETWVGFTVDLEHLNYFSLKPLSRLLHDHGLLVEQFWEHDQPAIQRTGASQVPSFARRITAKVQQFLPFQGYTGTFSTGSFVLTVLARRV